MECVSRDQLGPASSVLVLSVLVLLVSVCACACVSTVCVCRPGEGGACNDSVVMAEVHIHAAKLGVVLLLFTF